MEELRAPCKTEFSGLRGTIRVQINRTEDIAGSLSQLTEAVRGLQARADVPAGKPAYADAPAPGGVPSPSFGAGHDYGSWRNSWW
eukprot:7848231-Alexandrium_andersonii.AAC.1